MKNQLLKKIALGIITCSLLACQQQKTEATETTVVDKEKIKAEIVAMETVMAEMYNMRSVASEQYYAEDAVSFSQNKPPLVGKFAIDKSIKDDFESLPSDYKISFSVNEIFPSKSGNIVVEIASYKVVDKNNEVKFKGNYMSLFEKRDGKYVCIRDMGASDLPSTE